MTAERVARYNREAFAALANRHDRAAACRALGAAFATLGRVVETGETDALATLPSFADAARVVDALVSDMRAVDAANHSRAYEENRDAAVREEMERRAAREAALAAERADAVRRRLSGG